MTYKNIVNKILNYTCIDGTGKESYIRIDGFTCTNIEKNKIEQTLEDTLYVIGGKEELFEDEKINAAGVLKQYSFPGQKSGLIILTAKNTLKKTTSKDKISFSKLIILDKTINNNFYKKLEKIFTDYTY